VDSDVQNALNRLIDTVVSERAKFNSIATERIPDSDVQTKLNTVSDTALIQRLNQPDLKLQIDRIDFTLDPIESLFKMTYVLLRYTMLKLHKLHKSKMYPAKQIRSITTGLHYKYTSRGKRIQTTDSDVLNIRWDNGKLVAFGDAASTKWITDNKLMRQFRTNTGSIISRLKSSPSGRVTLKTLTTSAKGLLHVIDIAGNLADILGVLATFGDAMFYDPNYEDASNILTKQNLQGISKKSIEKQLKLIYDYNTTDVDGYNNTILNKLNYDWPRPKAQFPIIMGPLDWLGKDLPVDASDEYYAQYYLETLINTYMEQKLRTDPTWNQKFKIALNDDEYYNQIINDKSSRLLDYISGQDPIVTLNDVGSTIKFSVSDYDNLYRIAFTDLCVTKGGVVYEDTYPSQTVPGIDGTIITLGGRPRLQCGWGDLNTCKTKASEWYDTYQTEGYGLGKYAEWYDWTDPALQNIADPSGSGVISDPVPSALKTGHAGACISTNYGVRSLCELYHGVYNFEQHTCEYTQEYCQSIGTCYDSVNRVCQLPARAMEALNMFYGQGGVREWIRIRGCQFGGSPGQTIDDVITASGIGMILTNTGQQMITDALKNSHNWNEGFRQTLSDPTMAVNFAASVMGLVAAFTASEAGIGLAVILGLVAGFMAAAQAISDKVDRAMTPVTDPPEYTVGGLNNGNAVTINFVEGWLTKPIQVHQIGDASMTPLARISDFSECTTKTFFAEYSSSGCTTDTYPIDQAGICYHKDARRFSTGVVQTTISTDGVAGCGGSCPSGYDKTGPCTCQVQSIPKYNVDVRTWISFRNSWTQNKCYSDNKIRAGSSGINNTIWCLPQFPPTSFADTVNIGSLAPGVTTTLKNIAWTGYDDPYYPHYPPDPSGNYTNWKGGDTVNNWYYQVVYDKNNMVLDSNGLPVKLWDTQFLRKHFFDSTISDMRQYYCQKYLEDNPTSPLDTRCYVYVDIKYTTINGMTYRFYPMTVNVPGTRKIPFTPAYIQQSSAFNRDDYQVIANTPPVTVATPSSGMLRI
jgi:hypothetical protein